MAKINYAEKSLALHKKMKGKIEVVSKKELSRDLIIPSPLDRRGGEAAALAGGEKTQDKKKKYYFFCDSRIKRESLFFPLLSQQSFCALCYS